MDHPYTRLPPRAFWRSAVSDVSPLELADLYAPKWPIEVGTPIAAAGSCFAQHLGREFKQRGYAFLDLEPPPPQLPAAQHESFGYGLYSARYGNVYSVRQLLQLFRRARGEFAPEESAWRAGDRWYDPFRPSIEAGGFASRAELDRDRAWHLGRVKALLGRAQVFVFTFGLTEAWLSRRDGAVLPTCPGTVAGEFDAQRHVFHDFGFREVLADAEAFVDLALSVNPGLRFLFTVSPVPLTATASGDHVLVASVRAKSVLRAVCGELAASHPRIDYFPSYELVASHPMRAMFFQPNLRGVSPVGVRHVMGVFFGAHPAPPASKRAAAAPEGPTADEVACDEAILEAFRP